MPSLNRASYLVEDDRGSGRYRMLLEAQAGPGGGTAAVVLHDISRTGLLFEADLELEPGTEIALDIPALGVLETRSIWSNGRFYGAEFVTPLTPDRLRAVLIESKVVWPDFASVATPPIDEVRAQRSAPASLPVEVPDTATSTGLPGEPKWPLAIRLQVIIGLAVVLWSAILGIAWLALG